MKKLKLPLWLICDSAAALRLWLSLVLFGLVQRLFLPRNQPSNQASNQPRPVLSLDAAAWLIETQALCESLLRWATSRHAFRLCGLDPRTARYVRLEGADTPEAWSTRRRSLLAMLHAMTAHARKQASRIRQALAKDSPQMAARSPPSSSSFFSTAPSFFCDIPLGSWTRGIPAPP